MTNKRAILASETEEWLRRFGAPLPNQDLCQRTTDRLNHVRTPEQIAAWEELLEKRRQSEAEPAAELRWWDFDKVGDAAKLLNSHLPMIANHWGSMLESSETLRAERAVRDLAEALSAAIEYIEFPLGRYTKRTSKAPKPWHFEAIQIVRHLRGALIASGHNSVGEVGNFAMATIVSEALKILGYGVVEPNAAHNFLQRREKKFGLPIG